MNRKDFLLLCCGASAITFIASCGKVYYAINTSTGENIAVDISEFEEQKDGVTTLRTFVIVKNDQIPFPIALYRNGDKNYVALYLECTHSGCELRPASTVLLCPCHGSEFSTEGKVLNPPAEKDLRQFPVIVSENKILILFTA